MITRVGYSSDFVACLLMALSGRRSMF